MVKFLLRRPIAVIMAFLAVVILGCVTFTTLPVSLLPDVAIPHITVHVTGDNLSARELENTVVAPLRRQLMQVGGLSDIHSETRDASALISLTMDYGVNTDLAFIEVNEKIDAAMNSLPRDAERPKAVKASATDIPVLYVNMTMRNSRGDNGFAQMADIADNIVRRRLEQLPEVSMVDITGVPAKELRLVPDYNMMESAGVTAADIESALKAANAEPGSMTVRDGYYEYNIHVANHLRTPQAVRDVKFRKNGRIHTLGEFCSVELAEQKSAGYSLYGGRRAVTMAVIKHGAESMSGMEDAVDETIRHFSGLYPDIEFTTSRSQTELLDFTISNLEQNLILGLALVFLVCALFMRSVRLPFIVGLTIIVAVIVTFLLFYLFRVSINIISLAGLILAVGMMIDNSVIVAENITQFRQRGLPLAPSCIAGTNEMITPMLSSSLTTVAVFVPLVFMSGIAGAIFADQAFAITAGLAASYVVGITLLPVLYNLFFTRRGGAPVPAPAVDAETSRLTALYDRIIDYVFRHRALSIGFVVVTLAALWPALRLLDTERMPRIDSDETMLTVDWNENINIDENRRRSEAVAEAAGALAVEHSAYVGVQDYMLGDQSDLSGTQTEFYFRTGDPSRLDDLRLALAASLDSAWPGASYAFAAPANVFEKVFSSSEAPLEARLSPRGRDASSMVAEFSRIHDRIGHVTGDTPADLQLREQIDIAVDHELMAIYNVDYAELQRVLQTAFKGSSTSVLRTNREYIPVRLADQGRSLADVLDNTLVTARPDRTGAAQVVPLRALVRTSAGRDFRNIRSDAGGEFVPVAFDVGARRAPRLMEQVTEVVAEEPSVDVAFTGSLFSNMEMMRELTVILIVSLLMMYFILCAQLESFLQPLVVLLEIPLDITFALLSLWICGQTLNLMSAIGIIVTCGIVVNDSILKLDAINEYRGQGMPLLEAIHTAGRRRLKPIIMTSLTTVFAMVPVLFTSDMGSELQRPLAIAMIGSMIVGTLVSIFIIPLFYYLIYRNRHAKA